MRSYPSFSTTTAWRASFSWIKHLNNYALSEATFILPGRLSFFKYTHAARCIRHWSMKPTWTIDVENTVDKWGLEVNGGACAWRWGNRVTREVTRALRFTTFCYVLCVPMELATSKVGWDLKSVWLLWGGKYGEIMICNGNNAGIFNRHLPWLEIIDVVIAGGCILGYCLLNFIKGLYFWWFTIPTETHSGRISNILIWFVAIINT